MCMLSKQDRWAFIIIFIVPILFYALLHFGPQTTTENDGLGFVVIFGFPFWLIAVVQLAIDFIVRIFASEQKLVELGTPYSPARETLGRVKILVFFSLLFFLLFLAYNTSL